MRGHVALVFSAALVGLASCAHAPAPPTGEVERRDLAVTAADIQILDRAAQLLSSEAVWNRADDRSCPEGATRLSLFCALQQASIEVLGAYDHRRAALQEVRFVIDERGKQYDHRLMGFNNDPSITLADIQGVLDAARARVQARLPEPAQKQVNEKTEPQ